MSWDGGRLVRLILLRCMSTWNESVWKQDSLTNVSGHFLDVFPNVSEHLATFFIYFFTSKRWNASSFCQIILFNDHRDIQSDGF